MKLPRLPARFPYGAPTWPTSVPRARAERRIGVNYDTGWARRYPVRLVRAAVLDGVTRPLMHAIASPTIEGLDRLEAMTGPAIFAPNHASHIDTPLLLTALPERIRHRTAIAAAADTFFDKQWKAAISAFGIGAIPIERIRVSPQSTRLGAELIKDGWNLVIFPEGGRSPDGWGRAHRAGAAYLAQRTGAPIVPVHMHGTRRIQKKGGKGIRPSSTRVSFGRPLRPDEGEDTRAFAARVEHAIAVLADEEANGYWQARRHASAGTTPGLTGPAAPAWRRTWALAEGKRRTEGPRRWPRTSRS